MSLIIKQSDFLATIQDLGRYGYQHVGATTGGPMDEHAFLWNNRLLDNPPNSVQIEVALGMFSCIFRQPVMVALAGAQMNAKLNGQAVQPWGSFYVRAGDILELSMMQQGQYCYLAVKDGFNVTPTFGSCATVTRDGLGGLDGQGRKLQTDDIVDYTAGEPMIAHNVPARYIPAYDKEIRLGVIPSAQYHDFSADMQSLFFRSVYTVSQRINRMGYRLSGTAILSDKTNLFSEGVGLGAIQVPADGQPIVLMCDRQTIGGYPKIGYICKNDLGRLAQSVPGTKISFYKKDIIRAAQEYRQQQLFFRV